MIADSIEMSGKHDIVEAAQVFVGRVFLRHHADYSSDFVSLFRYAVSENLGGAR